MGEKMGLGKKALAVVASLSPVVATALGGPLAGGLVKTLAAKLTGGDENALDEYIANADPAQAAALKEHLADLELEYRKLDLQEHQSDLADTANARELGKVKGLIPHIVISALFVIGFFFALWAIATGQVQADTTMNNALFMLLGVLSAEVTRVMTFWMGSSMGSKEKSNAINAAMQKFGKRQ